MNHINLFFLFFQLEKCEIQNEEFDLTLANKSVFETDAITPVYNELQGSLEGVRSLCKDGTAVVG